MDSQRLNDHWGNWIKRRILHLGYKTQKEFALKCHFNPRDVSRWVNLEKQKLHKKSRDDLAIYLKTHPEIIADRWQVIAPENAPSREEFEQKLGLQVIASGGTASGTSSVSGKGQIVFTTPDEALKKAINDVLANLPVDGLAMVFEFARRLSRDQKMHKETP